MKKYVLLALLLAVLSALCTAQIQNQNLKFVTVNPPPDGLTPTTIHFYCSQDYDKAECLKDTLALRQALAPYPTRLLGQWSYYLVMAGDWKPLVQSRGGASCSPAFSLLLGRATVLERSLFSPTADRSLELERCFGPIGQKMINLAITHEMGHAICQDKNERHADDYGEELRAGKIPDCSKTPGRRPSTDTKGVAETADTSSHQ